MNVSEVHVGEHFELSITLSGPPLEPDLREDVEIQLIDKQGIPTLTCELPSGAHAWDIEGVSAQDKHTLQELVRRNMPHVAWVSRTSDQGRQLFISLKRFQNAFKISEPLEVGVDDKAVDDLKKYFKIGGSIDDCCRWLSERLLLPPQLKHEAPLVRVLSSAHHNTHRSFRVFGRQCAIDIKRVDDQLRVERVLRRAQDKTGVSVVSVELSFKDYTQAGVVYGAAKTTLSEITGRDGSYLKIWQAYSARERELHRQRAEALGAIEYVNCDQQHDGGWGFEVILSKDDSLEKLTQRLNACADQGNFELIVSEEPPHYDHTGQWQFIEKGLLSAPIKRYDVNPETLDSLWIYLKPDQRDAHKPTAQLPSTGSLSLSLVGDLARIKRREAAERKLREGSAGIPTLGLLMEGRAAPIARQTRYHLDQPHIKKAIREAFQGGKPNRRQREAIEVALNTPDICLIQGPPGTGKTKVISAIQLCFAAIASETQNKLSHRVLVTAAQHDAVDTVAARSRVFGLPAIKVGRRRGSSEEEALHFATRKFAQDQLERLEATIIEPLFMQRLASVKSAILNAQLAVVTEEAHKNNLRQVLVSLSEPTPLLGLNPELIQQLEQQAYERSAVGDVDLELLDLQLKRAKTLRVEPITFSDDGPKQARLALSRLKKLLNDEEVKLLERCAEIDPSEPRELNSLSEGDFEALSELRDRLIDLLSEPTKVEPTPLSLEHFKLLSDLLNELVSFTLKSRDGVDQALTDYLETLEHDLDEVQRTLSSYVFSIASTLQHSVGRDMFAALDLREGAPTFDTVIVDEAARAHPLDLFIPLSIAIKRVALVGDHRQLPHLLEPEVERAIRDDVQTKSVAEESLEAIKSSLFERLWGVLNELSKTDNIKRVVTLNTQFRMHPTLGRFMSERFYELHGDSIIESPRGVDEFKHDLPGYQDHTGRPAAAAFLDVPYRLGPEVNAQSKYRPAEAEAIARELRRLINHDARLSFGVIAFYSAQVLEVMKALEAEGLAERDDDGQLVIKESYRVTYHESGEVVERLRVGTVDAFQGKEFDVVFLSVGRSNTLKATNERGVRRKYGHLTLENRLCVAMSRQQRLLIMAGDLEFIIAPEAREPLKPLHAFYELCKGDYGVIRRSNH